MPSINDLPPEFFWLCLTILMTAIMWMPYIVNRILVNGLPRAMGFGVSVEDELKHSAWAARAKAAHANAVENLVIFAPLVVVAHLHGASPVAIVAMQAYFFCRLAHFLIYAMGIPVLRTLTFAGGWAAQMVILASIFGFI